MRSRGSKSFRFLQIISAANKQYAGARAPDRQQAAEPAAALTACIPLRRFTVFYVAACIPLAASLHSQRLLLIVISQQSAAILVLFVGRRYYLRPIILWNAPWRIWNGLRPIGTREALLEPPYRAAGPLGPFAL